MAAAAIHMISQLTVFDIWQQRTDAHKISRVANTMGFADSTNTLETNSTPAGVFGETPTSLNTQDHDQINDPKAAEDGTNLEMLCLRSAGADPHYFGSSSAYSFTKIFSASLRAVRSKAPGMSLSGVADSFTQSRPTPSPAPLPDRSLTTMLTSAYFEQIHPQFPFLHRPTYLQWEEEVLRACEQGYAPEPTKAFFVYAVSALKFQLNSSFTANIIVDISSSLLLGP